jgi:hypothetical protein
MASPTDPLTLIVVIGMMLSVAALAGYLAARRASRIDPTIALHRGIADDQDRIGGNRLGSPSRIMS